MGIPFFQRIQRIQRIQRCARRMPARCEGWHHPTGLMPDLRFLRNGWGTTGKARPTPRKDLHVVRYMYHAWLHRLHWRMYHGLFNLAVQMWWFSQFASAPCPFCGEHHFDPLLPSTSIIDHWQLLPENLSKAPCAWPLLGSSWHRQIGFNSGSHPHL